MNAWTARDKTIVGIVATIILGAGAVTMKDGIVHGEAIKRIDEKNLRQDRDIDSLAASNLKLGETIGEMKGDIRVMKEILQRLDERDRRAAIQAELLQKQSAFEWIDGVNLCDLRSSSLRF